jgi:hypothetical protein
MLTSVFTVSTLVVQIAVIRFTPLIISLFTRSFIITATIGFVLTSELFSVWINMSISDQYIPRDIVIMAVVVFTLSTLGVFPFFSYFINYLDPGKVVANMRKAVEAEVTRTSSMKRAVRDESKGAEAAEVAMVAINHSNNPNTSGSLESGQRAVVDVLDRLADLGVKALASQQKIVAMAVLDAFLGIMTTYSSLKSSQPPGWFQVPGWMRQSPDFSTLSGHGVASVVANRTWFQWKILRKFQLIFNQSLADLKDVCNLVAMSTGKLGLMACEEADTPRLVMVVKFFNTFLRYAINAKEVRTIYNILEHYRKLTVFCLERTMPAAGGGGGKAGPSGRHAPLVPVVLDMLAHIKYYARVCYELNLLFICETISFDLATVCERAYELNHPAAEPVFNLFVSLLQDTTGEVGGGRIAVAGRRAQARLAAKMLALAARDPGRHGKTVAGPVSRLAREMTLDPVPVLKQVFEAFRVTVRTEFWEINDRGTSFDFLTLPEKAGLAEFFARLPACARALTGDDRRCSAADLLAILEAHHREHTDPASPMHLTPGPATRASLGVPAGASGKVREEALASLDAALRSQPTLLNLSGTASASFLAVPLVSAALFGLCLLAEVIAGGDLRAFFFAIEKPTTEQVYSVFGATGHFIAMFTGLVLTVSTIVVQIAASRFTPLITTMFFRAKIVYLVCGFFIVTILFGVWVNFSANNGYTSRSGPTTTIIMVTLCMFLMGPYFRYLLLFLEPSQIITRVLRNSIRSRASTATATPATATSNNLEQNEVIDAVDRLSDLGLSAVQLKDINLATKVVAVLSETALTYGPIKGTRGVGWFLVGERVKSNLDFISLSPAALQKIEGDRTWLEWKILRQLHQLYSSAFVHGNHLCHLITLQLRVIAVAALERRDLEAFDLTLRFFNTFIRFAINSGHIRQLFNTVHQYRLVLEFLLIATAGGSSNSSDSPAMLARLSDMVTYLRYYYGVMHGRNLMFVCEVVCHDFSDICKAAFVLGHAQHDLLLDSFLSLATEFPMPEGRSVRGVRAAQVKLAAVYLSGGDAARADIVARELAAEGPETLGAIYGELMATVRPDFWEISDRSTNMLYMTPAHRALLKGIFASLGVHEYTVPANLGLTGGDEAAAAAVAAAAAARRRGEQADPAATQLAIADSLRSREDEASRLVEEAFASGSGVTKIFPSLLEHVFGNFAMTGPVRLPSLVNNDSLAEAGGLVQPANRPKVKTFSALHFRHVARGFLSHIEPFFTVLASTLAYLVVVLLIDMRLRSDGLAAGGFAPLFTRQSFKTASQLLFSLVEVLAIIFNVLVTICIGIVNLTASRFTPLLTSIFFTDPVVVTVLISFASGIVIVLWVEWSTSSAHIPQGAIMFVMVYTTVANAIVLPFCSYILEFFNPSSIISHISSNVLSHASPREGERLALTEMRQVKVVSRIDDLIHVCLKAIQWKDKAMVGHVIDALSALVLDYWKMVKPEIPRGSSFLAAPPLARSNMAFVFMSDQDYEALDRSQNWLEWKVLYTFQTLYVELLASFKTLTYIVSNNTLLVSRTAVDNLDYPNLELTMKIFNTYIRHGLNKNEVRSVFIVLSDYRQVAEYILQTSMSQDAATSARLDRFVIQIASYLRYYSSLFLERKLYFLSEVCAHDLGTITDAAFRLASPCHQDLLDIFLTIDDDANDHGDEVVLRGIRRAQVKLATSYLIEKRVDLAQQVMEDLLVEPEDRLEGIFFELTSVDTNEFWEVNDRGVNLDYLTDEQKQQLPIFLCMFPNYRPEMDDDDAGDGDPEGAVEIRNVVPAAEALLAKEKSEVGEALRRMPTVANLRQALGAAEAGGDSLTQALQRSLARNVDAESARMKDTKAAPSSPLASHPLSTTSDVIILGDEGKRTYADLARAPERFGGGEEDIGSAALVEEYVQYGSKSSSDKSAPNPSTVSSSPSAASPLPSSGRARAGSLSKDELIRIRERSGSIRHHSTVEALMARTRQGAEGGGGGGGFVLPVETTGSAKSSVGMSSDLLEKQKELLLGRGKSDSDESKASGGSSGDGAAAAVVEQDDDGDDGKEAVDRDDDPLGADPSGGRPLAAVEGLIAVDPADDPPIQRTISTSTFFGVLGMYSIFPLIALFLFIASLAIDVNVRHRTTLKIILSALYKDQFWLARNSLINLPEAMSLHVRIVLLVSVIAVQISAMRFTPLISALFFHSRVINSVLVFFTSTSLCLLWIKYSINVKHVPSLAIITVLATMVVCFAMLVPYFAFVLNFLQPRHIINHIAWSAVREGTPRRWTRLSRLRFRLALWRGTFRAAGAAAEAAAVNRAKPGSVIEGPELFADPARALDFEHEVPSWNELARREALVQSSIEQLTDLMLKALSYRDRIIAARVCTAFRRICIEYTRQKHLLPAQWFRIADQKRQSADFVNLTTEAVVTLVDRRVWVEWKILRQFQAFYAVALGEGKELCFVVAINTRKIGEEAVRRRDVHLLDLAIKFFNTYLRYALNARDVRVMFNVIYQYTQLAQNILQITELGGSASLSEADAAADQALVKQIHQRVVRIALFFVYYSNICLERELSFISQVFAFDLCTLCTTAFALGSNVHKDLLGICMTVDDHARTRKDNVMLHAIRRAQVHLAALYVGSGRWDLAREVFEDMEEEPEAFLRDLLNDLRKCDQQEFWEINDRGLNFDYLSPAKMASAMTFFNLFKGLDRSPGPGTGLFLGAQKLGGVTATSSALFDPSVPGSASSPSSPSPASPASSTKATGGVAAGTEAAPLQLSKVEASVEVDISQLVNTDPGTVKWVRVLRRLAPALFVPSFLMVLLFIALLVESLNGKTTVLDFIKSFFQNTQVAPVAFNALYSLPMVIATLLVLVISVSTVVVQITATRFTPLIIVLFFKDPVISGALGFMITTEILVLISAHIMDDRHHPATLVVVNTLMVSFVVFLLFPFFSYLLFFLDPSNIVTRISQSSEEVVNGLLKAFPGPLEDDKDHGGGGGGGSRATLVVVGRLRLDSGEFVARNKDELMDIVERLTDLGFKAIQWRDNIVASNVLNALGFVALHYGRNKSALLANVPGWRRVNKRWQSDSPDFLNLSPEALADLENRATWVEWKILRAFQLMFQEALSSLKELCFLVGTNTRKIGALAAARGDTAVLDLTIKFFNTFSRLALVTSDARTAYNIFHQYRQLAQDVLVLPKHPQQQVPAGALEGRVLQIAEYVAFYGEQFLVVKGVPFMAVVAAHDVMGLCLTAFEQNSVAHPQIQALLEKYMASVTARPAMASASARVGISIVHIKLWSVYHLDGPRSAHLRASLESSLASMSPELAELVDAELSQAKTVDFWEVNDRGGNLNYVSEVQLEVYRAFRSRVLNKMRQASRAQTSVVAAPAGGAGKRAVPAPLEPLQPSAGAKSHPAPPPLVPAPAQPALPPPPSPSEILSSSPRALPRGPAPPLVLPISQIPPVMPSMSTPTRAKASSSPKIG